MMMDGEKPIADGLWNPKITSATYISEDKYYDHLFEQYKIVIEAADKVIERRNTANTLFLTIHTLFITGFGLAIAYKDAFQFQYPSVMFLILVPVVTLCYIWWRITKSYRQLNTAKYQIIGEYERVLPSSPYWSAEWKLLGEGKNKRLYWPLTDIEQYVPVVFAILYVFGTVIFAFL